MKSYSYSSNLLFHEYSYGFSRELSRLVGWGYIEGCIHGWASKYMEVLKSPALYLPNFGLAAVSITIFQYIFNAAMAKGRFILSEETPIHLGF